MANGNLGTQKWEEHLFRLTSTGSGDFPTSNQHFVSSLPLHPHANHCMNATAMIVPSLFRCCNYSTLNHTLGLPSHFPADGQAGEATQRRFLIFDQSGDRTRLIVGSLNQPIWNAKASCDRGESTCHPDGHCECNAAYLSDQTTASSRSKEMPDDSNEIDALLYSDSEHGREGFSNGHLQSNEEVGSSDVPPKKRRLNEDMVLRTPNPWYDCACGSEESSCGEGFCGGISSEGGVPRFSNCRNCEKRRQILETVSILQRIIPCGKGKNVAMVLDKAIHYLRSLKLKAKVPGSVQ